MTCRIHAAASFPSLNPWTQERVKVLEEQNLNLEQRLARAEQDGTLKQKVASLEEGMNALRTKNQSLKDKNLGLENAVQDEKRKMSEYRRKVRALSVEP